MCRAPLGEIDAENEAAAWVLSLLHLSPFLSARECLQLYLFLFLSARECLQRPRVLRTPFFLLLGAVSRRLILHRFLFLGAHECLQCPRVLTPPFLLLGAVRRRQRSASSRHQHSCRPRVRGSVPPGTDWW